MAMTAIELRQRFQALRANKVFEIFVISVIIFSALVIGAKTYEIDPNILQILLFFDYAITLFFLVEIVIRMIAEPNLKAFFRKGWNLFDFIIVVVSILPVEQSEMALLGRLLRIFRVLRLVSIVPELRVLLNAFVTAIPRMGYVSLLMFIIFYIYAAVGSILFQHINPYLWGNISIALLTLFRIATFESWTEIMYETMEVYPLSWIFYISFIFVAAFVFLNMMIGIVLETLQREHEKFDREHGQGEAGEIHWMREHAEIMEQRMERMEQMLSELTTTRCKAEKNNNNR